MMHINDYRTSALPLITGLPAEFIHDDPRYDMWIERCYQKGWSPQRAHRVIKRAYRMIVQLPNQSHV